MANSRIQLLAELIVFFVAESCGSAQTLKDLYEKLEITIALPTQNRSMSDTGNPKIDPALRLPPAGQPGNSRDLGGTLAVIVTVRDAAEVAPVRNRIVSSGGEVTSESGRRLFCRLPSSSLDAIAALPQVLDVVAQPQYRIPPPPPTPTTGAVNRGLMQAGLAATRVSLLHQKGFKGSGVKVGILDFGFSGYRDLQARGNLPAPKATQGFGRDRGWDRGKTGTPHGTACAEIIHLMAPEAELYIAAVGDGSGSAAGDEIRNAAHWLMDQQVDIISFSGGGHSGPHNGKDDDDDLVEEATRRGILWVVSAGNEGNKHWQKDVSPANDQIVRTAAKDFLLLFIPKGEELSLILNWDDWNPNPKEPRSSQSFIAVLNRIEVSNGKASTAYVTHALPRPAGAPRAVLRAAPKEDGLYAVFLIAHQVTRKLRVHAYVEGAAMYPVDAVGSIGIPATSPFALSVGAVNVDNGQLEPFSSQGPTDDGRAKPDISAPDRVFSEAYRKEFPGTSAACPFAAGFAALVRQMKGKIPPAELARIIKAATTPLANNAGAGNGLIDASKLPGMDAAPPPGTSPPPQPAPTSLSSRLLPLFGLARTDNPLGLRIVTGHPEYHSGDGLKLGYRAQKESYCFVIRKSSRGVVTVVSPTGGGQLRLAPGEPNILPAAPQQTIPIAGAVGSEEFALVCSAAPISPSTIDRGEAASLSVAAVTIRIQ